MNSLTRADEVGTKSNDIMPDHSELTTHLATRAFEIVGGSQFSVNANLSASNTEALRAFGVLESILLMAYNEGQKAPLNSTKPETREMFALAFTTGLPPAPQQAFDWLAPRLQPEEQKALKILNDELNKCTTEVEKRDEALDQIRNWADAYPLQVFPEPDLKRAAAVLHDAGMTLDAISASIMRHVLKGVKKIVEAV